MKEAEAFEKEQEKSKKEGQSFPKRGALQACEGAPGGAEPVGRQGALGWPAALWQEMDVR